MANVAIRLENVSYSYSLSETEYVKAVQCVSLSLYEGEFVAVIGQNGGGKSTFARLLNGLLLPDGGRVLIYGVDTREERALRSARSSVGMVFQNPDNQLIASNLEDDVAFGPENLGVPREEIVRRVDWALSAVGINDLRRQNPYRLSGGQKQRAAIAGVLALKPKVLVLDEATAMLDPHGKKEVMDVVKKLNAEGMAVVMITHFMDEALCADRLLVLSEGKIVADGKPKDIFADYERLKGISLSIPNATRLARELIAQGVPVPPDVMTEESLAEEIVKLLSH